MCEKWKKNLKVTRQQLVEFHESYDVFDGKCNNKSRHLHSNFTKEWCKSHKEKSINQCPKPTFIDNGKPSLVL